jgi:hypothetical protein
VKVKQELGEGTGVAQASPAKATAPKICNPVDRNKVVRALDKDLADERKKVLVALKTAALATALADNVLDADALKVLRERVGIAENCLGCTVASPPDVQICDKPEQFEEQPLEFFPWDGMRTFSKAVFATLAKEKQLCPEDRIEELWKIVLGLSGSDDSAAEVQVPWNAVHSAWEKVGTPKVQPESKEEPPAKKARLEMDMSTSQQALLIEAMNKCTYLPMESNKMLTLQALLQMVVEARGCEFEPDLETISEKVRSQRSLIGQLGTSLKSAAADVMKVVSRRKAMAEKKEKEAREKQAEEDKVTLRKNVLNEKKRLTKAKNMEAFSIDSSTAGVGTMVRVSHESDFAKMLDSGEVKFSMPFLVVQSPTFTNFAEDTGPEYIHRHQERHSRGAATGSRIILRSHIPILVVVFTFGVPMRTANIYITTNIGMCDLRTLAASWSSSLRVLFVMVVFIFISRRGYRQPAQGDDGPLEQPVRAIADCPTAGRRTLLLELFSWCKRCCQAPRRLRPGFGDLQVSDSSNRERHRQLPEFWAHALLPLLRFRILDACFIENAVCRADTGRHDARC